MILGLSANGGAGVHESAGWRVHSLVRTCYAEWQRLWATVPVGRAGSVVEVYLPVVTRNYSTF